MNIKPIVALTAFAMLGDKDEFLSVVVHYIQTVLKKKLLQ
jgi:hypothetical protein